MYTHPFVRRATRQQTKPPLNIMPLTNNPRTQQGLTLVELMVGIAIGLLVVAVAMGALMVSRGISGTVSDASGIQQQAAYAMRLIGQQLRQAGSMRLNLNPGTTVTEDPHRAAVAFETVAVSASSPAFSYNAGTANQVIAGADSPDSLTVGFRRYTEPVFTSATERSQVRNCLGGPDDNTRSLRGRSALRSRRLGKLWAWPQVTSPTNPNSSDCCPTHCKTGCPKGTWRTSSVTASTVWI